MSVRRQVIIDLNKKLKEFGESNLYNEKELKKLEEYLGEKIEFAYLGWISYAGEKNKFADTTFCGEELFNFMLHLYDERFEAHKAFAEKVDACKTAKEVMELCCKVMLDYAQSWKDKEVHLTEDERAKNFLLSVSSIEVEQGKLVLEGNANCYDSIVIRTGDKKWYRGSMVIKDRGNGQFSIQERTPLGGIGDYETDSLHLMSCAKKFMEYMAY